MDGVTILNTYIENASGDTANLIVSFVLSIILTVLTSIAAFAVSDRFHSFNAGAVVYIIVAVLGAVISVCSAIDLKNPHKEAKVVYEVMVTEEASFIDFMDKYNIIEHRGNIYVVEERERSSEVTPEQ